MLIPVLLAFQVRAATPPLPERTVEKPGVIATDQRITPAGVQSVFTGRVSGVRFGATAGELWVIAPNGAYRLNWRDNAVLAHGAFDGRPGVHGLAWDPVTSRALVSSVGRLPASMALNRLPGAKEPPGARVVAQLRAFGLDATRDSTAAPPRARLALGPDSIGDYLAGGVSVARTANRSGHRPAVVALPANDRLAIIDADSGAVLGQVELGVLPVSTVVATDGSEAWVSIFGGRKPRWTDRTMQQCCDPRAEKVRIDKRGIAARGAIWRVDLVTQRVTAKIDANLHPAGLAWDQSRGLLYAANGNSDDITLIDTRAARSRGTIRIAPFHEQLVGLAPTALALSPDGKTLYATLGGLNAVAIYDVSAGTTNGARLLGLIPTGWYPTSIDVSADGTTLAVGTLLGPGAGIGEAGSKKGLRSGYVHAVRGSVHVIMVPDAAQLAAYTTSVAQNNRLSLLADANPRDLVPRGMVAPRAVPERPGEPGPIKHVVYLIRENRTYDQVLGDLGRGAGDSSLTIYGRAVTPNAHALSEQFVTFDHFFASGGNSADGHQWLTQANETSYPYWPLYTGRSYPSESNDALTYSSGGFIWEAAQAKGHRVTIFGEYAPPPRWDSAVVRNRLLEQWRGRDTLPAGYFSRVLAGMYHTKSKIPSLDRALVREYPSWTQSVPDVVKAELFNDYVKRWTTDGAMPNLVMAILPSDHTEGTSAGWCAPRACVADNDLALGTIIETLSHSPFWREMAIFVVEDDAQDGVDHIDGHRTVALVASPYARRGIVDSTFYSQPSLVKTVELMLGLPALSMYDLVATDMRAAFIGPAETPDFTPYTARPAQIDLFEKNVKAASIDGPYARERRAAALASARMNFREPDAAPSDRLNRILWHDARGWDVPYPGVNRAVFFPLSIDLADDDREEAEEAGAPWWRRLFSWK